MGAGVRQKRPGDGNPWRVFINYQGKRKAIDDRPIQGPNESVFAGLETHLAAEGRYLSELAAASGFSDRAEGFFVRK